MPLCFFAFASFYSSSSSSFSAQRFPFYPIGASFHSIILTTTTTTISLPCHQIRPKKSY